MKKLSKILTPILLITAFLLVSCKDDVVKPPPPPTTTDTTDLYTWTSTEVGGYLYDLYVADSNNIYITGSVPIFYNGKTFQYVEMQDPDFRVETIRGYDKNNIFFGGHKLISNHGYAVLKKMTNGIISSFTFENDSNSDITDILVTGTNEAWLSTSAYNNIYFFNNGSSTLFKLDSGGVEGKFFKDTFGNLYVFALKLINSIDLMVAYKFVGNHFVRVSIDTVQPPSELTYFIYVCGMDLLMSNFETTRSIFYFNGMQWLRHSSSTTEFPTYKLGGDTKDTLIGFTFDLENGYTVRIWDGTQWRREKGSQLFNRDNLHSYGDKIYTIDENIYFVVSFQIDGSYLVIGKPNKKNEIF